MAQAYDINRMSDKEIVDTLLSTDTALRAKKEFIAKEFFYKKCYTTFYSFYDNYETNCKCCKEFIDEIFVLILTPSKITHKCQLENFRGESSLKTWLKTVCLYYCYSQFGLAERDPLHHAISSDTNEFDNEDDSGDRNERILGTSEIDLSGIDSADIEVLLSLMPNKRYSKLIRLLYLEQKTHKETAYALGMTMKNYYNKRILAEKQFMDVRRKEEENG